MSVPAQACGLWFSADWRVFRYRYAFLSGIRMRITSFSAAVLIALLAPALHAEELVEACHASSSYDLTIAPKALVFDRAEPAPQRIDLHAGSASADGVALHPNAEEHDRLVLFEQELRALVPKAKSVATNGVDMAIQAVRSETATLGLSADTRAELDARLAVHAADLKRRIADSRSTHDWQGDAFERYAEDIAADLAPLIATDLGSQAVAAALGGDVDAAADLRERAGQLGSTMKPRLERRMQALRPQIVALCPSIQRLYELQHGVRGLGGRPLDLLEIEPRK
jgi:hypothetical protein